MEREENDNRLGQYILRLRNDAGLGLRQLARQADINPTWLMRVEQGKYVEPDPKRLARLATALGLEVVELYEVAGYPAELPSMQPYLRTKYGYLPDDAIDQLAAHFELINEKYLNKKKGGRHDEHSHQS